jgi:adenylate cyclase
MSKSRAGKTLRSTLWLYLSLIAFSLVWLLLDQIGALRPLENLSVNARFKVRGALPTPLKLVYVDIDTPSLTDLGNFPWDRAIFKEVCEMLVEHGKVKAIGIDVVFSSAGVPNLTDLERFESGQTAFGKFLFNQPPVVLASSYASGFQTAPDGSTVPRIMPVVNDPTPSRHRPEVPEWPLGQMIFTPPLVGLIDTLDGDTRRVPIYTVAEDRSYYHIALELARIYYGVKPDGIRVGPDKIELVRPDGTVAQTIPLIDGQMVDINWFSPWIDPGNPRFPIVGIYGVAQALKSEDPEERKLGAEAFAEFAEDFRDAIILIGPVDPLMQDLAITPFDRTPVPKVGVHGNMVKTIVSGRFLKSPPNWALPLITIGLTAVVVGLSLSSEGRRATQLRLAAAALLAGYIGLSFAAFSWFDWVLPMVAPLGAAFSAAFVGGAAQLVLAQKQKSRIKGLFGAYLAPSLVSQMVDSGQEPKLGGVEEEITAYFSDIQSFSTFSEVLSPHQLVELMNEYLTACTDIVQAEGGTLDKYIGDAVVAMYGAPLALPGHAHRACVAALTVDKRCGELREKWRSEIPQKNWPDLVTRMRTRVGLNSGRAVVGNMGSASRFSYTMMGDTVNLAARMESGAKSWGVYTMCADPTRVGCQAVDGGEVVFRSLGRIVVKGRKTAVPIHELVCLKSDVTDRTLEAIATFEAGLERFYQQDWDGALAKFEASAVLEPRQPDPSIGVETNPSRVYQRIVAELRAAPPGPGWNGAYVMREK